MRKNSIILAILLLSLCVNAGVHPNMLISSTRWDSLQGVVQKDSLIWQGRIKKALSKIEKEPSSNFPQHMMQFQIMIQAKTIGYAMGHKRELSPIVDSLKLWNIWKDSLSNEKGRGWGWCVPPGSAFMTSILVLDLLWNDLSISQQKELREIFSAVAVKFKQSTDPHWLNQLGVSLAWSVFEGDSTRIDSAAYFYRQHLTSEIASGGLHGGGTSYAWDRLAGRTMSKALGVPLLIHHRQNPVTDPMIQNFYTWLYCGTSTPWGKLIPWGDTGPWAGPKSSPILQYAQTWNPLISTCAEQIRVSSHSQDILVDLLLTSLTPLPQHRNNQSLIMGGGYAKLQNSQNALFSLWNPVKPEWHAHPEANGVYFGANGVHHLTGTGYAGARKSAHGLSWKEIHGTARNSNIFMLRNTDTCGVGLPGTSGILLKDLQIAYSFDMLPNQIRHRRTLILSDIAAIVVDDLGNGPRDQYRSYWHPFSSADPAIHDSWIMWRIHDHPELELRLRQFPSPQKVNFLTTATVSQSKDRGFRRKSAELEQTLTGNRAIFTILISHRTNSPSKTTLHCSETGELVVCTAGQRRIELHQSNSRGLWEAMQFDSLGTLEWHYKSADSSTTLLQGRTTWRLSPILLESEESFGKSRWLSGMLLPENFEECSPTSAKTDLPISCSQE